jgi:hypothetical protein
MAKEVVLGLGVWTPNRPKYIHGALVEVDRAPCRSDLATRFVQLISDRDKRPVHRQSGPLEVDVTPAQAEDFASAHSRVGSQPQGSEVGAALGQIKDVAKLICIPGSNLAGGEGPTLWCMSDLVRVANDGSSPLGIA